jgi:hypothetical protein
MWKNQSVLHNRKKDNQKTDRKGKTNEDQVGFKKLPTYKTLETQETEGGKKNTKKKTLSGKEH